MYTSTRYSKVQVVYECFTVERQLSRPRLTGLSIIQTTISQFYLRLKFKSKPGKNPLVVARSVLCVGVPVAFGEDACQRKRIGLTFLKQNAEAASADITATQVNSKTLAGVLERVIFSS